jgi:hypothetical protein
MEVTDLFDQTFSEKWNSRSGPIIRPPRSPELTPLEIFFSELINDALYVPLLTTTLPELAGRVRHAVATGNVEFLNNVLAETIHKCDICRRTLLCSYRMSVKRKS